LGLFFFFFLQEHGYGCLETTLISLVEKFPFAASSFSWIGLVFLFLFFIFPLLRLLPCILFLQEEHGKDSKDVAIDLLQGMTLLLAAGRREA
jgi:hypothetical protein